MQYELNNTVKATIDESLIKKAVKAFAETVFSDIAETQCLASSENNNLTISIAIVDDKTMRKLNKQYRGKDKTTDVLSFSLNGCDRLNYATKQSFLPCRQAGCYSGRSATERSRAKNLFSFQEFIDLGEIIISWPQTKKQAREYKTTVKQEFTRLLVHGLAHLAGYDHEKGDKEAKKMEDIETEILSKI